MMNERNQAQPIANAPGKEPKRGSRRGLIVVIIALAIVLIIAFIAYSALSSGFSMSNSHEGEDPAPNFTMTTLDGETVDLASFQGKPVVLNFWASTCGPCKNEMPGFQDAYERYGDRVDFVMVDVPGFLGETKSRALALLEQSGYEFPVYFDDREEGSEAYDVTSIPRTYFITADGYIYLYGLGSLDEDTLFESIERLLRS